MRLALGLALGALLGAARAGELVARQQANPAPTASPSPPSAPTPSSTDRPSDSSTPSSPSTPSTPSTPSNGDVTVVSTVFVTSDKAPPSTITTTVITTVRSVVVVTSTVFAITVVTSRDQDTSTSTVYETLVDNRKRSVDDATLETSAAAPAHVDAAVTGAWDDEPRHALAKRATITRLTTVVVGNDNSQSTEVRTVSRTATALVTSETTTTSVITETNQANAKTTVTVTSTLVIMSTRVSTDVVETSTPTGDGSGGSDGRGRSSSSNSGLSTGAKAGIGVGAALGGLAVLGMLAFLYVRRRRSPKPDHDDFMGASEVPVGGPASGASGSAGPMSDTTSAAGHLAPGRSHSGRAEGYRGTAMGDGRAGYAKPTPYGSAYTSTPSTTMTHHNQNTSPAADQLPRHPTPGDSSVVSPTTSDTVEMGSGGAAAAKWYNADAAEIDSQPAMSHQSGPVYEMPTGPYR